MAQEGLIKQDLSKELVRGKQAAFQYKPVEDTQLAWLSQTQNQRNYLESERKIQEQRDLRDNLAKIEGLGLPKEMQGYLNSNVEDLINKVRNGEIDPESYDFRRMVQTISSESNQLNNINNNLKTLAAEDKQVIIDGRDVSGDYKDQYFGAYNTDYVPGTNVYDKYAGLQLGLQGGTDAIEFDDTTANTLLNDYIERNVNTNANISKLKQDGFSGYNLIKELATLDPDAAQNWIDYLNTQSQTSLISEYAKAEKTANAAGIPIEPYEEWKKDRLKNFIPNLIQTTSAEIEADTYAEIRAKERAEGIDLSGIFSDPVEYNLSEYGEENPISTYGTTLNLKTETYLDYTDPSTGEKKRGQPSKINRFYYDPNTDEYIIGFNAYVNTKDIDLKNLPDNAIVNYIEGDQKNKYYLDKSKELTVRVNLDDMNFNALTSGIQREAKADEKDVMARVLALKDLAQQSQINIPERETAEVNGKRITVDTSSTITVGQDKFTYPQILKMFNGDKAKAVNYWNNHSDQSAEGNKARRAQEVTYIEGFSNAQVEEAASKSGMTVEEYIEMYNEQNK